MDRLQPEFSKGAGSTFRVGQSDHELDAKERKYLRVAGLTSRQAAHIGAQIKHPHELPKVRVRHHINH